MPRDIRSFFGGGAPSESSAPPPQKEESESSKKKGRPARRVVEDSDDDVPVEKSTPKKAAPKKQSQKPPSPPGVETTTSDYFGSKNKPKRSEPVKPRVVVETDATPKGSSAKSKAKPTKQPESSKNTRTGRSKPKPTTSYAEFDDDNSDVFDDVDPADDIFTEDFKKGGRKGDDDYEEADDDEEEDEKIRTVPRRAPVNGKQKKSSEDEEEYVPIKEDVEMQDVEEPDDDLLKPEDAARAGKKRAVKSTSRNKRKSASPDFEQEEESDAPPKKRGRQPQDSNKSPAKKRTKKEEPTESTEVQAIYDSIPLVRPPTPPPQSGEAAKFNFRAGAATHGAAPAAGTAEIPVGAPNCLAGLTFVFTGLLQLIGRDEGVALVKRYGGKVTTAPSKKTSYVVLGSDAGPKKLQTIRQHGLKTIDENGLFELVRRLPANGGDSKAAAAYEEKQKAEIKKIQEMAAEIDIEERKTAKAGSSSGAKANTTSASHATNSSKQSVQATDNRLWTVKYAPTQLSQICGNKTQVEKIQRWLRNFPKNQRTKFKLAGADGSGVYRAIMIHGPPGIGKTTAAHLVAKLEGYDIVESNASDTRSKKLVESGLKGVLSTTSLLGYFSGDGKGVEESKKKLVLIMDEVDGMSAGDRGGVGALAKVCRTTQIPMILICNDRRHQKMKPFDHVTYDLPFRRPTIENIRSRIMTIAYREGLKLPPQVVNALIEGSHSDIRQVVNMVSTAKLDQETMDFDSSKEMSKAWQKHVILKPWDIIGKILGGGLFAESSKSTLNDKIELYFNDHEFSYLMLQENYLGTNPIRASNFQGKERNLRLLELADQAAESISDGDLVDRMIHGSQQQWSLMPTHAIFSFVKPASYISGSMANFKTNFTSWLGKNSSQQKLGRMVKEIQGHMRLRSSGDRHEVRQHYIPMLWSRTVKKLQEDGKEAVPDVIDLMDSYFLTKEDYDAIAELGVGPMDQERIKIDAQTKSSFTRLYNQQSHPLPFMKASSVTAPKKAAKEVPDLEEAIEEEDDGEEIEEPPQDEDDVDLSKDKYVQQPKKRKAAAKSSGKGKKAKVDKDDDPSEEEKPKKARASKGKQKK